MIKYAVTTALLLLASCNSSQITSAIIISADALPCYQAVRAATLANPADPVILTGANVIALNPACAAIGAASANLIASAVNAGVTPVAGPVPMRAGRKML